MASPTPLELVFKHVDGLDIGMDVYIPESVTAESPAPIVLWWHGGGLLQGTRKGTSPHHLLSPSTHHICFISADYRLAPQTRLPDILTDCTDALTFLSSPAFATATGHRADAGRVVLSGSSAGGWLALLCGAGIAIGTPPALSYFPRVIDKKELEPYLDPAADKVAFSALDSPRALFYHYMLQEGIETELLLGGTGIPPETYSVALALKSGKYTLPPTYIVHGDIDDKVPARQSRDVVAAAPEVQYDELEGVDHLFDKNPDVKMENMYSFMHKVFNS
ncbi:Alpha/Beta hydrolase protein [Mucidula mucida]|nr:Alpha/Beta hydrolase protein [Mucidula mucida]